MKIHLYAMCNKVFPIFPYFLRHYETFCDRLFIVDDGSNGELEAISSSHKRVTLLEKREIPGGDDRFFQEPVNTLFKNDLYKKSRGEADWVVVVDVDEFIWHPEILRLLKTYSESGITFPEIQGYEMVSEAPPSGAGQIYDEIKDGFQSSEYSKHAIFHPGLEINFSDGCHVAKPVGNVVETRETDLKLLHYRFLGVEYALEKYMSRISRMTPEDVRIMMQLDQFPPGVQREEHLRQLYYTYISRGKLERVVF